MAPRKRHAVNRGLPVNLYAKKHKATGAIYYQYCDQRTGKFIGFGTDRTSAIQDAIVLNATILAEQASNRVNRVLDLSNAPSSPTSRALTLAHFIEKYLDIQQDRLEDGEIRPNTHRTRKCAARGIAKLSGEMKLTEITTKNTVDIINHYVSQGKKRMAQTIRATLIDIFTEAIALGEAEHNPAAVTKNPKAKVQRQRLVLSEYLTIYDTATLMVHDGELQPWVPNALQNALVMAQRLEDIAKMKFTQCQDGHLCVEQSKTNSRIKIPVSLRLTAVNTSIEEAIAQCRDGVLSRYMVHHIKFGGTYKPGRPVHPHTISHAFTKVREATSLDWPEGLPPTFHELRSLSKRLYDQQGINTKVLLGHKTTRMADLYADDRGREWQVLEIS
jgi:hypothetical protein